MNIDTAIEAALAIEDRVESLQALIDLARYVDGLRSELATLKALTAAEAVEAGVKQIDIAAALGVTPMLVQQWVKRGRAELATIRS